MVLKIIKAIGEFRTLLIEGFLTIFIGKNYQKYFDEKQDEYLNQILNVESNNKEKI